MSSFFNKSFEKSNLKSLLAWSLFKFGEQKTLDLTEQLKNIGFMFATQAGISLGLDDLQTPPTKIRFISEAEEQTLQTQKKYKNGKFTAVEKFEQLINTWHRTSELLKQDVIQNFKATDILNPVYMMAFSGARGNISQVRQLVGMRGLMADPQGRIIDFPIQSNFREGLTLTEYVISCYGARKGLVDTALRTANSGYLTRRLVDVSQHVIIGWMNCGTTRGISFGNMIADDKIILPLQNRLVGRVLAEDIGSIACKNEQISMELARKIAKIKSTVLVRSPLTCKHKKFLCQFCYGWSLAYGTLVSLGEAVGVLAAQSIGEPGTQLTMRTFHTGGVFSGGSIDEIRAPFEGFVYFHNSLPGKLIRTSYGKIAFLTKKQGELFLCGQKKQLLQPLADALCYKQQALSVPQKSINNLLFQSKQILGINRRLKMIFAADHQNWLQATDEQTVESVIPVFPASVSLQQSLFQTQKKKPESENSSNVSMKYRHNKTPLQNVFTQKIKFCLPASSIVFTRNGEKMFQGNLIAEFSYLSTQKNQQTKAEHKVHSDIEGQVSFKKSFIVDSPDTTLAATSLSKLQSLWIVSGKIYTSPVASPLLLQTGDFVDNTTLLHTVLGRATNSGLISSIKPLKRKHKPFSLTDLNLSQINVLRDFSANNRANKQKFLSHEVTHSQVFVKQPFHNFYIQPPRYKKFSYFFQNNFILGQTTAYFTNKAFANHLEIDKKLTNLLAPYYLSGKQSLQPRETLSKNFVKILTLPTQLIGNTCWQNRIGTQFEDHHVLEANILHTFLRKEVCTSLIDIVLTNFSLKETSATRIKKYRPEWAQKLLLYQWFPNIYQTKTGGKFLFFEGNQNRFACEQTVFWLSREFHEIPWYMQKPRIQGYSFQKFIREQIRNVYVPDGWVSKAIPLLYTTNRQARKKPTYVQKSSFFKFIEKNDLLLSTRHDSTPRNLSSTFQKGKKTDKNQIMLTKNPSHEKRNQKAILTTQEVISFPVIFQSNQDGSLQFFSFFQKDSKKSYLFLAQKLSFFCFLQPRKKNVTVIAKQKTHPWFHLPVDQSLTQSQSWQTENTQVSFFEKKKSAKKEKLYRQIQNVQIFWKHDSTFVFHRFIFFEKKPHNEFLQTIRQKKQGFFENPLNWLSATQVINQPKPSFANFLLVGSGFSIHQRRTTLPISTKFSANKRNTAFFENLYGNDLSNLGKWKFLHIESSFISFSENSLTIQEIQKLTYQKLKTQKKRKSFQTHTLFNPFLYHEHQLHIHGSTTKKTKKMNFFHVFSSKIHVKGIVWAKKTLSTTANVFSVSEYLDSHFIHQSLIQKNCKFLYKTRNPYFSFYQKICLQTKISDGFCFLYSENEKTIFINQVKQSLMQAYETTVSVTFFQTNSKSSMQKLIPQRTVNPWKLVDKFLCSFQPKKSIFFPFSHSFRPKSIQFSSKYKILKKKSFPIISENQPTLKNVSGWVYVPHNEKTLVHFFQKTGIQKKQGSIGLDGVVFDQHFVFNNIIFMFATWQKKTTKTNKKYLKKKNIPFETMGQRRIAQVHCFTPRSLARVIHTRIWFLKNTKTFEKPLLFFLKKKLKRTNHLKENNFCPKSISFFVLLCISDLFWVSMISKQSFCESIYFIKKMKKRGQNILVQTMREYTDYIIDLEFQVKKNSISEKMGKQKVVDSFFENRNTKISTFSYDFFPKLISRFLPSIEKNGHNKKPKKFPPINNPWVKKNFQCIQNFHFFPTRVTKKSCYLMNYFPSKSTNFDGRFAGNFASNQLTLSKKRGICKSKYSSIASTVPSICTSIHSFAGNPFNIFWFYKISLSSSFEQQNEVQLFQSKTLASKDKSSFTNKMYTFAGSPSLIEKKINQKKYVEDKKVNKKLTYQLKTYRQNTLFYKRNAQKRAYGKKIYKPHCIAVFQKVKLYSLLDLYKIKKKMHQRARHIQSKFLYDEIDSKQKETKLFSFLPSKDIETKIFKPFDVPASQLGKKKNSFFSSKVTLQRVSIFAVPSVEKGLYAILRQIQLTRVSKKRFFDSVFFISAYTFSFFYTGAIERIQQSFSLNKDRHSFPLVEKTDRPISKETWLFEKKPSNITDFVSPYRGEIVASDGRSRCIVMTHSDQVTVSFFSLHKEFFWNVQPSRGLGQFFRAGEEIFQNAGINQSGQIIQVDLSTLTLRAALPFLVSSGSMFHVQNASFVEKNTQLFTLFYQIVKTGDIVQGIPKIEQLFEARGTLVEGRELDKYDLFASGFPIGLSARFMQLYTKYSKRFSNKAAVRKSFQAIQQSIVQKVYSVYQEQGVYLAEKHLEIIVRQMTSFVLIVDPGKTSFLQGEIMPLSMVEKANNYAFFIETTRSYFRSLSSAYYLPVLFGITKAALHSESFISAASFQETTRVLSQAAIEKRKDYLRGLKENVVLGRVIPAGTGFPVWGWKTFLSSRETYKEKSIRKLRISRFHSESVDSFTF